jgi:RNA polymerase sigma-70 factor (ECF subfamily)
VAAVRRPSSARESRNRSRVGSRPGALAQLEGVGDADLLVAAAAGDLAAIGELYDRHAGHVWRAAHRSLDDTAAEDVVHQLFLKLPELALSYDGRPSCRGWLCGIALRLAMRHRRGAGRLRRMLAAFSHTTPDRSTRTPEHEAIGRQRLSALERALSGLSEKNRVVFVLVEIEDLSSEEAARVLQIPAGTVRRRLFQARKELHAALERGEP